jgi:hypothetical protein
MIVFGIALSGLFPLVAIMSRELQPWKPAATSDYKCTSPARDGNTNGTNVAYERHTWYLTAYDDPWARRLGASAAVSGTASASTPPSMQSSVVFLDDSGTYGPAGGSGTFSIAIDPTWGSPVSAASALNGEQFRKAALPKDSPSTGTVIWSLTVSAAGWYSIQATWSAASDQADDAQYSYRINSGAWVPAVQVDQSNIPVGVTDSDNHNWRRLTSGLIQLAANATVQVQLSDVRATSANPGTYVAADAVRVVQNEVNLISVERSADGQNSNSHGAAVTANVSVKVNISQ